MALTVPVKEGPVIQSVPWILFLWTNFRERPFIFYPAPHYFRHILACILLYISPVLDIETHSRARFIFSLWPRSFTLRCGIPPRPFKLNLLPSQVLLQRVFYLHKVLAIQQRSLDHFFSVAVFFLQTVSLIELIGLVTSWHKLLQPDQSFRTYISYLTSCLEIRDAHQFLTGTSKLYFDLLQILIYLHRPIKQVSHHCLAGLLGLCV